MSSFLKNKFKKATTFLVLIILFFPISFFIYGQLLIAKARAEATIVWDGGGDGSSWSDGLNWSTDVVPSTEDIVLIDTTTTVNINAPITIASLLIGRSNGSVSPVLNFAYDGINSGALTINNGDLIVYSNASITHTIGTNVVVGRVNINVSNGNAQIYGNINVNGKGFAKGQGDSPGVANTSGAGGGSHGGIGGHGNGASGVGGLISYGSITAPVNIGSGGGIGSVPSPDTLVSNGGGAVKLVVSGTLTVNGSITANGDIGPTRSAAGVGAHGGGAGGSIWLDASSFAGTGSITAQGGNATAGYGGTRGGGSGGGGRIALHYSTDTSSLSTLSASGGKPDGTALSSILLTKGGAGTVYKKDKDLAKGEVIIDNKDTDWSTLKSKVGLTPLPNNLDINSLVVRNYSNVEYGSTLASSSILVETLGHLSYTGSVSTTDLEVITNGSLYNESTGSISYSSLNWTGGKLIDNGGTLALLSGGGSLTIPASSELSSNVARSYTGVVVNGVLTHSNNVDTELYKINISTSGDFTVSNTGSINVSGKGYAKGQGDSPGIADTSGAGGGSHGGIGGHGNGASGVGGLISYGDMTAPFRIGSGGGIGRTPNADMLTVNGGGAVKLVVSGTLTVNGSITANGDYGLLYSDLVNGAHGGGAGGSIWLDAGSLAGTGSITAQGGNASAGNGSIRGGGSGGGGRIALHYSTDTSSLSTLSASGGKPDGTALSSILLTKGGAGTVYKKDKDLTKGEVIIDNKDTDWSTLKSKVGLTPLPNNLDINSLVVRNYSNVEYGSTLASSSILVETLGHLSYTGSVSTTDLEVITNGSLYNESTGSISYSSLNWTGGKLIDNGGTLALLSGGGSLTIPASSELSSNVARSYTGVVVNGVLTHSNNVDTELYKINISTSGDFTVSNTGSINVSGKGYAMGYGLGAGVNGNNGAGGGAHGGNGGNGQTRAGGTAYGNNMAPDKIGSGGGYYEVFETGSAGGGAVKINSIGTVTINGVINANGLNGIKTGHGSGGGAGGSIWIISDIFTGTGSLSAIGGSTINTTYDGGGGGGGKIALLYRANESNLTSVSVTGGQVASGSVALAGVNGTIVWGGRPYNPSNLRQFKNDGSTGIAVGESTDEVVFIARLLLQDDDSTDTLTVEVECLPVGSSFTNVATHTGTPVSYIGTPINADVTVDGLADKATYHWQARVCDASLLCSDWTSFGANLENEVDLRIGSNSAPNSPVIPESSYYINGSLTNNTKPTIGFVLTDSNSSDTVGYKFQLDDSDDFNTPIIDYESVYSAQGTQWFTIGQAEGDGEYIVGSESDELVTGSYYWRVKTYDDKGAESSWTLATGDPSFRIDLTRPTNASDVKIKSHAGGINMYAESDGAKWFNRIDPFFSWSDGSDDEGVKGYCLYLGQNPDGDPATEKGILGSSPVSTTGTSCQFIINDTEIDFANSAYRTVGWLSSSEDKYYFKVKTIDVANNVYVGEDDTNFVSFKFDSTAPQNVTSISSASSTFSSTADMYFSWTTGVENGASDDHSDLMGFQYAVNSRDEWFGGYIDDFTGISYLPINTLQPYYLGQDAQEKIQLGQNTLFFRVVDFAGNYSELRTTILNYGGEAPNFAQGSEVDVNPDSSDDNNFEFSWPEASVSEGNIFSTYYYMVNTPPPLLYSTITSNSATYIPTTDNFVTQRSFPGLRKGSNIVYVVAVDEAGNYSSSNYISGIFYLDTELPDPPTNVMVSDSSIKDASIWRVAIVWDDPVYKGTGTITYIVQRSEDGQDWTNIAETTATAYVDTVPESSRYYWRVATVDNSDESKASPSYSNAVSTIPRGKYLIPPSLTSGPAVSSITTTKAKFSWTTNRSSDSKISFGLASGNYFDWEPSYSAHVTDHIISLSNLEPGKTYYYKARWTDEDGNTGVSEEKSFTTEDPPTVKDVRITNLGISGAIVNFTTINASKAKIYFGITPDFGGAKEIATSKIETSYSVALDSLQDGTKYYFKINTFDEEDAEYSGTTLDFTTMPRPKVTNVIVQQVAKTAEATLLVTWDSNTSVSSIVTYYPEKNPELVKDAVDIDLKNGQHKMILRGLFPDTSYVITVRGRDIIGNEAVSNSIRVVTSEDTRAPLISNLSVEGSNIKITDGGSESTTSQLIITWNTDEPSTSQVEYGEGSGSSYSQLTQQDNSLSTNHVVIISGLNPSKVYHFRAISKDSAGNESKSVDTVTITPKATDNAFDLVITTLKEVFRFLNEL